MQSRHHRHGPLLLNSILLAAACAPALATNPKPPAKDVAPLTPDSVYRDTFRILSAGQQSDAEAVLREGCSLFPEDARLLFFAGACLRSRFDVVPASFVFARVTRIDRGGVYGAAAGEILLLDVAKKDPEKHFAALQAIVANNPDDPLLTWMAAVQCRSLNKNQLGVSYFESLSKHFTDGPGPVLFHQTYANLLDQVDRYDDALPHRHLAVKLEPATWSYSALGDTLTNLKRWDDADDAYRRALEIRETAHIWENWAGSFWQRGDDEHVIPACRRSLQLAPNNPRLWNRLGDAHRRRNQPGDPARAATAYRTSLKLLPNQTYAPKQLASLAIPATQPAAPADNRVTVTEVRESPGSTASAGE